MAANAIRVRGIRLSNLPPALSAASDCGPGLGASHRTRTAACRKKDVFLLSRGIRLPPTMLRYREDLRTLAILSIYALVSVLAWMLAPRGPVLAAAVVFLCINSWLCAV